MPTQPTTSSKPATPARSALSRQADTTLAEQLAARYAERIAQQLLLPGARLPSVRECASEHGVSPSTVVAAYDRLLARGLVQARPQRGHYVRETAATRSTSPKPTAPVTPATPRPTTATALIRGMFQGQGGRPMPGLGTVPAEWLDLPLLQQAMRKVLVQPALAGQALRYGDPAGESSLRQALAERMAEVGVQAQASQIITTVGATQALDIITRTLLQPGDPVLVDEPGWAVEYARLARAGMRLLPVPRGEHGPDLAVMQRLIEAHAPKLYVTVSVLHNPTGYSLSLQAAHQVLQLAHAHGLTIVEDDTYAYLAEPHCPRLSALDGLRRCIYVSGFSKILAPGWRVGYMAAPPDWVDALVDTKLLSTLSSPSLSELALAECLTQGAMRRHAERVRQRLDAARERTVRLAHAHGFEMACPPRGLFGWVQVGADTDRLAQRMLDDHWLLAPGSLFHATPRPTTLMRVNFSTSQDPKFWQQLALRTGGVSNL
jgi:DNA-binding transcriptional MocR family regulator